MKAKKQLFQEVNRIKEALTDDVSDVIEAMKKDIDEAIAKDDNNTTIDKEDAIAIVKVIITHHLHPDYNEELKSEVFSKWDWELFSISKEISQKIREF
jgi:hypothetical protein